MAKLLDKAAIRRVAQNVPGAGACVVYYDVVRDGIRVTLGDRRWVTFDQEIFLLDEAVWAPCVIREIRRTLEVA